MKKKRRQFAAKMVKMHVFPHKMSAHQFKWLIKGGGEKNADMNKMRPDSCIIIKMIKGKLVERSGFFSPSEVAHSENNMK